MEDQTVNTITGNGDESGFADSEGPPSSRMTFQEDCDMALKNVRHTLKHFEALYKGQTHENELTIKKLQASLGRFKSRVRERGRQLKGYATRVRDLEHQLEVAREEASEAKFDAEMAKFNEQCTITSARATLEEVQEKLVAVQAKLEAAEEKCLALEAKNED